MDWYNLQGKGHVTDIDHQRAGLMFGFALALLMGVLVMDVLRDLDTMPPVTLK